MLRGLFGMSALVIAVTGASSAQAPAAPQPSDSGTVTTTASERRMFPIRSKQAWEAVRKRLDELTLASDKTDAATQAILTRWRDVGSKGLEWLPDLPLQRPYVVTRVRFVVFVSPFAEPARVSVGSVVEGKDLLVPTTRLTFYNLSAVNKALMGEIVKVFGQEGVPVPANREDRRKTSLSFLSDAPDACLLHDLPLAKAVTAPKRIPLSEFEILYPTQAIDTRAAGLVRVQLEILEDGTVANIRLVDSPLGRQLDAAAIGAVSLLLYSPARSNDCAVPAMMTYSVRYRVQ